MLTEKTFKCHFLLGSLSFFTRLSKDTFLLSGASFDKSPVTKSQTGENGRGSILQCYLLCLGNA
jgi:hypothetical protein